MQKVQKAKKVLTIILTVFIGLNVLIYFMPFARSEYGRTDFYLFTAYVFINPVHTLMATALPVITFVLLLIFVSSTKYSNIAYTFTATHIIYNVMLFLSFNDLGDGETLYTTSGYVFLAISTLILFILLISLISINGVMMHREKITTRIDNTDTANLIDKLEKLNVLKNNNIITQEEYEKKRSEVIENLKL